MNKVNFIKISNKKYEAKNIDFILEEENKKLKENYIDGIQEVLVYDLLLKNLSYRITCEFFRQGYIVDNELDLLNIVIDKGLLVVDGIDILKNDMVISIGVYKEREENTNEIKSRYYFGRC